MGEREEPRVGSVWGRLVLTFVVFLVLSSGFGLTLLVILSGEDGSLPDLDSPRVYLGGLALQAVAGLLTVFGVTTLIDRRRIRSLGLGGGPLAFFTQCGWGAILGAGMAAVTVLLIAATSGRHINYVAFADGTLWYVLATLTVVGLAVVMEELLFRGYVYVNAVEAYGVPRAVFLSALAFTAIHGNNPGAGFLSWINILLVGVVLGQLRAVTGGLALPIGIHAAWNLVLGMGVGARVSGLELPSLFRVSLEDVAPVWGGGDFGPEASVVLTVLFGGTAVWLGVRWFIGQPST